MNSKIEEISQRPEPAADFRQLKWTTELAEKFWDYQSRFPEAYFSTQFGAQIAKAIQNATPKGGAILDYACGIGGLTGHLLEAGLSVAGCDLSPESIIATRNKHGNHSRFLGAFSMAELARSDLKFDVVVLAELIEHVDDELLHFIFNDAIRLLSPGGVIIITTPNNEDLSIETVYCPCCNHTFHRWQHVRSWSAETLSSQLRVHNLNVVKAITTDFSLAPQSGLVRYWMRLFLNFISNKRAPHLLGIARKMS